MLSLDQQDALLVNRAALKGIVANLEHSLGVAMALAVTLPALAAIDAMDRLREESWKI